MKSKIAVAWGFGVVFMVNDSTCILERVVGIILRSVYIMPHVVFGEILV